MSFREWEKFRFNDICDVKGGKRLPKGTSLSKNRNLHPYIRIRDMYQNKYIEINSEIEYVDDDTFKKIDRYIVNGGDVILAIVGNTIGLVSLVGKSLDNASLTENCVKLVNLKGCIAEFLYYYLISTSGQNEILKGIVGTSQPKLPIYNVQGIRIELPSLREQEAIVEVLSCLDEKIEVNNQINKTLEKMAQAIFKQWFVDFEFPDEDGEPYQSSGGEMVESELGLVPKGWEVAELKELADMKNGINYGRKQTGTSIKVINVRNFDGSIIVNDSKLDSVLLPEKQIKDYLLDEFDTVIVRSAKPGETLLVMNKSNKVFSGFTIRVRTYDILNRLYLFYSLRNGMKLLSNSSNGTVFNNLNQQLLGSLKVVIPQGYLIKNYNQIIKSMLYEINNNTIEVTKLIKIRDTLLPGLMAGEISMLTVTKD